MSDPSDDRPRPCIVCQVRQDGYGPDGEHCFGCAPLCVKCDRALVFEVELCARCRELLEEAEKPSPVRAKESWYSPTWNRDCGRWLP